MDVYCSGQLHLTADETGLRGQQRVVGGTAASAGMRIMSKAEMMAERRAKALAPLDTITAENAAAVLRETAKKLQKIYEADVADPKFAASMPESDVAEFKGTVTELWGGLSKVTEQDLVGISDEEADQLLTFVRHLARLTDDLSNSGSSSRIVCGR